MMAHYEVCTFLDFMIIFQKCLEVLEESSSRKSPITSERECQVKPYEENPSYWVVLYLDFVSLGLFCFPHHF